jgi:hypothetical protein
MAERKRIEGCGEIIYLTAFVLWLLTALTKYTYLKDKIALKEFDDTIFAFVLVLLIVSLICDFTGRPSELAGLFLLILFMTIAYASGSLQFAAMFALIFCAGRAALQRILKAALCCQLFIFFLTLFCMNIGVVEDVIWNEQGRVRHGLGFTHCMLASHFGLYMSIVYMAIVKKMTLKRAVAILALNGILFHYTDGRTDFYLSIVLVLLGFLLGNIGQRLKKEKLLGLLAALIPSAGLVFSIAVTKAFREDSPVWMRLNSVLNSRLLLGSQAIEQYGFTWFGQKIRWIGASKLYYDPTAVYNYVDNSYLMMMLTYGTFFILCYCVAMGIVLYRMLKEKETMIAVCLLVALAFGMINPQSMYLTYNPLLVLLADVWNPPQIKLIDQMFRKRAAALDEKRTQIGE